MTVRGLYSMRLLFCKCFTNILEHKHFLQMSCWPITRIHITTASISLTRMLPGCVKIRAERQACREPQRNPGKNSRGGPFGEKIFEFVLYISERRRGPQTSRDPG